MAVQTRMWNNVVESGANPAAGAAANDSAAQSTERPYLWSTGDSEQEEVFAPPPRTAVVLALLAGVAATVSYLGAYAVSGALVRAEIIAPWPAGHDPRLMWMVRGFCGLMGLFVLIAGFARFMSRRHLRHIESMTVEDEGVNG